MERLTEKQSAGYDLKEMNGNYCDDYCKTQSLTTCNDCGIYEAIQRLAEYEDTGMTPEEIIEEIKILEHNNKCMEDTLERQYDNARKLLDEQEKDCDYWKREALKWANELGEQKLERGKYGEINDKS